MKEVQKMIDKTLIRMNLLGGMNDYIINVIGDETLTESWLIDGVPDEATEDDLKEIAEDDDLWYDTVEEFQRLLMVAKDWKLEY
jgi:hypothetical protein